MTDINPLNDFEPDSEGSSPPPALPPRPPRIVRPSLANRLLADHNPFYLLSAACMLASLLALTNSLSWIPLATPRLITLIVTLNLYEAALLGIALFLVSRRGLVRDGRMLLLLQAFFLADFAFLNAEVVTGDFATGVAVNAVLLVLAGVKLFVVVRVLRPSFTPAQFAFVLLELGLLFATPCALRWVNVHRGHVGPRDFYAIWWLLALLPALYEVVSRLDPWRPAALSVAPRAQAAPTMTYLAVPYVSLLAHVGILHYVYDVSFYAAHAAPLLLGIALAANRFAPTGALPRTDLFLLRLLLPAAAMLVSINSPLSLPHGPIRQLSLAPLDLAAAGAFLTYVYCFFQAHAVIAVGSGAAATAIYLFGPSRQQMSDTAWAAWTWTARAVQKVMPKTLSDWGVVGLIASFAFLGLGLRMSLKRSAPIPADEDSSTAHP